MINKQSVIFVIENDIARNKDCIIHFFLRNNVMFNIYKIETVK